MRLIKTIDLRVPMEELQDIHIVAKVEIRAYNFVGREERIKRVSYVQVETPISITEHYVKTADIPFIYAKRKATSDFNILDSSGEGLFLCKDETHLESTLSRIEDEYNKNVEEMFLRAESLKQNNALEFKLELHQIRG